MDTDPPAPLPGGFHTLGRRLLREAFPALKDREVEAYLKRTEARFRQATAKHAPPQPTQPPNPLKPTVLIVDDEEDLRDIMQRMLQRRGFETLTAGDTAQALHLCRTHPDPIDFVVIDAGLPGASASDFTDRVAAAGPGTRILYISGLPEDLAVQNGLISENALYMKKPFNTEALITKLRSAANEPARRTPLS